MSDTINIKYVPKDKLASSISILARDAGRIQTRMHTVGLSILKVWRSEGEAFATEAAEYLNNLMEASPYHTLAFSRWVGTNTNLSFSEENGKFYVEADKEGASVVYDRQWKAAVAKPFWELSPPKKATPFDFRGAILKAVDKAVRHTAKPVEGDDVPADLVAAIRLVASSPEHMARVLAA